MVMFDLPVKHREQARRANEFRNMLLDLGFCQVQLSVYARYTPKAGGNRHAVATIKSHLPPGGSVRIIHVTDNQWATGQRFSQGRPDFTPEQPEQLTFF